MNANFYIFVFPKSYPTFFLHSSNDLNVQNIIILSLLERKNITRIDIILLLAVLDIMSHHHGIDIADTQTVASRIMSTFDYSRRTVRCRFISRTIASAANDSFITIRRRSTAETQHRSVRHYIRRVVIRVRVNHILTVI